MTYHPRTKRIAASAALALGIVAIIGAHQSNRARAELTGDRVTGTVEIREIDVASTSTSDPKWSSGLKGLEITVNVTGLTPGAHGIHFHEIGKCDAPEFTSAGGHFDPGPHGMTDPDVNHPYHMGDLPNLVADVNGRARLKATTTRATLSPGPLSLFDADGAAVIVHADPDQGTAGAEKSGVSGGPRIACGVVRR